MIKIYVKNKTTCPIRAKLIKDEAKKTLRENGMVSDFVVEVAIVGKADMLALAKKYLDEENVLHNVLSFTDSEVVKEFIYPPGKMTYLGEVVVCYPKAVEEANAEGKLLEDKVIFLIKHGMLHLMGVHHD